MNFVETETPLFTAAATKVSDRELSVSSPMAKKSGLCSRTMLTAMVLTMMVFSFTLSGMMSASNWIVDQYVIPKMTAQTSEFMKPLPGHDVQSEEQPSSTADATMR